MKSIIQIFSILLLAQPLFGQELKIQSESSLIEVEGTSSLHDWTSTVKSMEGKAQFTAEGAILTDIKGLSFEANAEDIKSGKSGMDNNTYKALNTKAHPKIKRVLKYYSD